MTKRKGFKIFLVLITFFFLFVQSREEVKTEENSFKLEVDKNGNITWQSIVDKAQTNIRWRTKGFNILINRTKHGYPFGENNKESPVYIRIKNDGDNVIVKDQGIDDHKLKVTYILKGEKIREAILKNKKFYNALMKKIREKKDTKIYFNQYFETYYVVTSSSIKGMVIDAFKDPKNPQYRKQFKDGYYQYQGNEYYYDKTMKVVMQIRSKNLHNIGQIKLAENWGNKNEWDSVEYYNYPVNYRISSNIIVGLVKMDGGLLGNNVVGKEKKLLDLFLRDEENKKKMIKKVKKISIEGKEVFNPRFVSKMDVSVDKERIKNSFASLFPKLFIDKNIKYVGDSVTVKFPELIKIKNKKVTYEFVRSYILEGGEKKYVNLSYDKKSKTYKVQLELGISFKEIYGEYRIKNGDEKIAEDVLEGEGIPNPIARIGAGTLEYSGFDIEEGIPVTENYYKQVRTENYIINYRFKKKTGIKKYDAKSKIRWKLFWTEIVGSGDKQKVVTRSREITRTYYTDIKRKFSYWVIDKLEYYTLDGALIENDALVENHIKLLPRDCVFPKMDFIHNQDERDHIRKPRELDNIIFLGNRSAIGRVLPDYDPKDEVDRIVGKVGVRNDRLVFNGSLVMDDLWQQEVTNEPKSLETTGEVCGEKVLYLDGKKIESTVKNGTYDSLGRVIYKLEKSVNSENEDYMEYEIDEINSVRVHTPVVCDYRMRDAKEWCQLLEPDLSGYQLVLTKEFEMEILTHGEHLPIKGYGTRDFEKYTKKKEVIFPFDVIWYGKVFPKGSHIPMIRNAIFRIPEYVEEGKYEIKIRTLALNVDREEDKEENYANIEIENDIAINSIFVEVSGRLIDFSLENIKNTSMWEDVFRDGEFRMGLPLKELPLVNGNHPKYKNIGDFKKGYAIEIGVTTIGGYYEERYGVRMDFDFYVTDENYKNKRKVDVYYEAISEKDGKKLGLVRVGSERDKENLHFYEKNGNDIPLFTYSRLLFPRELLDVGSNQSVQRWKGEYCLPARLHICEEGFSLEEYLKKRMAFYFDEDFWIKKGKLILKVNLYTMKNGKKILSYINEENAKRGFFNNWRYETLGREKYNKKNERIAFQDGEAFVYDIAKSIWMERKSEVKKGY